MVETGCGKKNATFLVAFWTGLVVRNLVGFGAGWVLGWRIKP
jgi:hypothetical protein